MTPQQTRIVIVGAGFSGLATAVELQERLPEAEITLLEMQQRAGGMVWSEQVGDYLVEHGPITFPGNRLGIMKLCQKLGLTPQLGWSLLLGAFAATVLGSVGNPVGAVVGGLVIGIATEVSAVLLSPTYKQAVAFVVLAGLLLVRPRGLFARR